MCQEKLKIDEPALIRAMGGLGGGVAKIGSVCGALIGGIAAIASIHSPSKPDVPKSPETSNLSRKLRKRFEQITEEFGGINCRNISRVDWTDDEKVKYFRTNPASRRRFCTRIVGETARAMAELI